MNAKEFNAECAKYLGIFYSDSIEGAFVVHKDESMPREFDANFDANDRNMVLEKMLIQTRYDYQDKSWVCLVSGSLGAEDKDMQRAQCKCIEKILRK